MKISPAMLLGEARQQTAEQSSTGNFQAWGDVQRDVHFAEAKCIRH